MDATLENKMGLPPPYEAPSANPPPPPSYFGSAPPPPGMVIPPSAPAHPVPTSRTAVLGPQKMGPGPTGAQCPSCNKQIVTSVEYLSNNKTHIVSAILCVVAGCCCGCFIPYCMTSCKTTNHYCPSCKAFLGSHIPS